MKLVASVVLSLTCISLTVSGQEASSGLDLRATVAAEAVYSRNLSEFPRDGTPAVAGARAVLYPTWKINAHWTVSGAVQTVTRPWFYADLYTQGYGARVRVLQANLGYTRVWNEGAVVIRAGQLSSAFGSYLLHYDDADNPLLDNPQAYGYYYQPVTTSGLAGAQADLTLHGWDARVQFVNSSPANPRSVFAAEQYGNWAAGIGYSPRQGFRAGISGYRGPYLDRNSPHFRRGESRPRDLPATAIGVDAQWARGHWNVQGEWARFVMTYHAVPTFRDNTAWVEGKRVLNARWYVAARAGYLYTTYGAGAENYEAAVGFRPGASQLVKVGYEIQRQRRDGSIDRVFGVQFVTAVHPFSWALN